MNELYWITRLDAVNGLGIIFTSVGIIAAIAFTIIYLISKAEKSIEDAKTINSYRIVSYIISTIGILIITFVPNTKDALLIYGVGGTIDYIKSNETVQQLPDKCIQAIDKFVDSYIEPEENAKN